jgi:hypothetical protein
MKTFMYDWTKDKEYNQTPDKLYRKKYTYVDINMRHQWKKNTEYKRGDVVFDYIETKKFFILFFDGVSSNVDTIYDDDLQWDEYNAMLDSTMTNHAEILLQGDIEKYKTDNKYYDIYNVPTNIKIEQLAYDYYSDVNYWDVILVLNNMSTYLQLPQSNDIIIDNTLKKLTKWGNMFGYDEEAFEYLNSHLSTGKWGINKKIRTTFTDENQTGAYYLQKGDLIQVNNYKGHKDVLFYYTKQMPIKTVVTFNSVFPLNNNDVISLNIKDINIKHEATGGDTNFLNTSSISMLPHFNSMLTAADIYGLNYTISSIVGAENITFTNDVNKLLNYTVKLNTIDSNRTDVVNIDIYKDITIEEAVDDGYLVKVDNTFIEIDYSDEELVEYYNLLLKMYNKYFDEMNEKNNKYQFIKILKPEYINEFKQDYLSKRNIVKNIPIEDIN